MICSRVGLMIAYDDNDSARREEVLAVSRFEGAAIGTKTSGMNKQVLNPIKHGVRQVAISWGGVQSARSLIGLSRDLIRPFLGHHTPLYSVGVSYGASRKKIFKKS